MPPSPVVMFLFGWKEKTEVVGKEPIRRPLYSAPTACAASSSTAMPREDGELQDRVEVRRLPDEVHGKDGFRAR